MEINITPEQELELLRQVFDNYPESSSAALKCTKWDYEHFEFAFYDTEEDKHYQITLEDARKGLAIYLREVLLGNTTLSANREQWDAETDDAIVQCAIFGKIIYG